MEGLITDMCTGCVQYFLHVCNLDCRNYFFVVVVVVGGRSIKRAVQSLFGLRPVKEGSGNQTSAKHCVNFGGMAYCVLMPSNDDCVVTFTFTAESRYYTYRF